MNEQKKSVLGVPEIIVLVFLIFVVGLFALQNFVFVHDPRQRPACINNLRQIDAAKYEWALENGKTNGEVCTENDIKPYIKLDAKGNFPKCPQGGTYTIGKVGEKPTCSLGTIVGPPHVLP